MKGFRFLHSLLTQPDPEKNTFGTLLNIFLNSSPWPEGESLKAHLAGWPNLDKRYNMTIRLWDLWLYEDLKSKGYMTEENQKVKFKNHWKSWAARFESQLGEIFGKFKTK